MKKYALLGAVGLTLTGCLFGDEPIASTRLTKDFWLNWWNDSTDQHLLLSTDNDGHSGIPIIERTIFAVGFNDSFIIAKQHPDKQKEIEQRLFASDRTTGDYLLANPADTIWLSKEDSIYQKDGEWYHMSNGWNPPDSLKPYRAITYFHIVDIRNYEPGESNSYKLYTFDTDSAFMAKRRELGMSDKLKFTIRSPSLE